MKSVKSTNGNAETCQIVILQKERSRQGRDQPRCWRETNKELESYLNQWAQENSADNGQPE